MDVFETPAILEIVKKKTDSLLSFEEMEPVLMREYVPVIFEEKFESEIEALKK